MAVTPELIAHWEEQLAALRAGHLVPGRSVHLVGIGGIGMAGIALHLHSRGLQVTGSELTPSRVTEWLAGHGIRVAIGHASSHLPEPIDWVIKTPAVPEENVEVARARAGGAPVVTRGVVLPTLLDGTTSVAVSGTHGKTTTSSMIAQILHAAGRSPSYCIGGEIDRLGGVARVGQGPDMVVEADESDGTLVLYTPQLGVVTNVEYDHMEHFDNQHEFVGCFGRFVRQCSRLVYCVDDPTARALGRESMGAIGYGRGEGASVAYRAYQTCGEQSRFVLVFPDGESSPVVLQAPGEHQVCNATGAAAAAWDLGVQRASIVAGLEAFRPPRRRFEITVRRRDLLVVSDYAHHPTEIRAVVKAARDMHDGRVIAVYQPHRYTRTRALLNDFPGAFAGLDELILVPVYAASESPLAGGATEDLMVAIEQEGSVSVRAVASLEDAWDALGELRHPGDLVLILGAGDVEQLAHGNWGRESSL